MQLSLFDDSISTLAAHSAYSVQVEPPEDVSPFGPVIHSYSRAQAIEACPPGRTPGRCERSRRDGVLVDVTVTAKEVGFRWPVVITAALHDRLTPSQHDVSIGQDYDGRLWDALWLAAYTIKLADPGTDTVTYTVVLQEVEAKSGQPVNVDIRLWDVCGPGDEGEPVVTIGFPEDF